MDFSRYEKLRTLVRANFSEQTRALVDEALEYADGKLAGLVRYDGSPLLEHAAAVASIVISEVGLGRNSTISAILHDVVRLAHKQLPAEEFLALSADIRKRFGDQVVGITLGLANISELKLKVAKEQADNFRDLIVSYSEDPRVILIKLADRLEVMRSLEMFPREKWRKKSWESMNLYAQIAHKLGLYSIKSELEDIALKYLEPKDYEHVVTKLEESAEERKAFIGRFLVPIEQRLNRLGIKYHIKSRTKSIFSIWNKMHKQHVPFEGVYDIFAIRIIIDCPQEAEKQLCWTAYSVVTDFYTPNPKRMRDWISIPKSNGYESLHTTVSAEGRWVEVQIRTERMDAVAERGIAAHWRYKGVNQGAQTSEMWLGHLRELIEDTTHSLAQRFDAKPASGEIFVFTPNGDLRKLPEGATLLDFAFDIHTSLGSTCVGGRVNGRAVPIREQLRNGDIVEITTQKNQTPKSDWLSLVVTSKARNKIKSYLREEQAKHTRMGREELERKLKNWKFAITIDEAVAYLAKYFKLRLGTEVYALIATQKLDFGSIKEILSRHLSGEAEEERRGRRNRTPEGRAARNAGEGRSAGRAGDRRRHLENPVQAGQMLQPDQGRRRVRIRDDQRGNHHPPLRLPQRQAHARELPLPRDRRPLAAVGRRGVPRHDPHRGGRHHGHGKPHHRGHRPRSQTGHPLDELRTRRERLRGGRSGRRSARYGRRGHAHTPDHAHQGRAARLPRQLISQTTFYPHKR